MKQEDLNNLKNLLSKEYDELYKFLYNSNSLDVDSSGDETDKIQAASLNKMENFVNARKVSRLREIDEAMKRIENGLYGQCEDCTENIGIKRLNFNPCIRSCIACAELREIEFKKR